MNFDDIQKSWQEQPSGQDMPNPDLQRYKEAGNILGTLRKNIKKEFFFWIFCTLFLFAIPLIPIYKIAGYAAVAYYFIIIQLSLSSMVYYRRFYYFYKSAKRFELLGTREHLLKLYYDLKYAIETYRIAAYMMMPQGWILFLILIAQSDSMRWLGKLYHLRSTFEKEPNFIGWIILSAIASIVLTIVILEIMMWVSYGKYLRQIKDTLEQLEE